ncbi:MAG: restriction endonuclease subunit S [Lewinellaceae bacterium]|nr:restriction endonuclease subunit S [Lewinellaceae bacterium]
MSKEEKIVPQLRFPEFAEEWKIEPLDKVYTFKITNSLSRDKLNYESGEVKNIHYGDIHTKFSILFDITKEEVPFINQDVSIERIDEENYCKEGDIVIADASEDLDDIGKSIEIINLNNEKLLAGLHTFLARRRDTKIKVGFGGYLFKSDDIRKQIKKEAQGAKVLGISKTRISNINIYYPPNPKEQQKIAACLSSLDEVITAETEKLDLLQDHKKGLLQQLFPAEEESQPNYRFPEFKDDGDWGEKEIGEIIELLADYTANGSFASLKENVTYYSEDNYAVLVRTTDLEKKKFEPQRYTDERGYKFLKKTSLFGGEIILANVRI